MTTRSTRCIVTDLPEEIDRACLLKIKATFDEHVKARHMCHVLNLDRVQAWETETVRAIIIILRTLRNAGGELRLVTARSDIRAALSLTAMDKILRVYADELAAATAPDENVAKPGPLDRCSRTSIKTGVLALVNKSLRFVMGLFLFILTGALAPGATMPQTSVSPSTASTTDPEELIQRLVEREPDLQTYKAHVHVKIRVRSFPFLAPTLDGEAYFKRPGKYEVIFDRVPFYAKGFERVYADIGDPSNWNQRFLLSYSGQVTVGNHSDIVLKLVQRIRGMIDHELVMIDPAIWHIDQMQWYYYNGGTITMTQLYSNENGFDVVVRQSAEIKIPHVSAVAQAQLSNFQTNVAVDDTTFSRNQPSSSTPRP